jgi:hypothetical protein
MRKISNNNKNSKRAKYCTFIKEKKKNKRKEEGDTLNIQ